ncbi:MAG: lactate racemase domain-containing protein [Leptolyngbyaceae cyanobacterium MO_188.B28]|nr:lactate racemase domain-containing protein [Leptolyngbyaceae cyanobacterium MO_188.B28]
MTLTYPPFSCLDSNIVNRYIELISYPGNLISLPPDTHWFKPRAMDREPLARGHLVKQCAGLLMEAITNAELEYHQRLSSLLLILPDKTRAQAAAHILVDGVLQLKQLKPFLQIAILYGLGTHPFMSQPDIQRLMGRERYKRLLENRVTITQQSTKATTHQMAKVAINGQYTITVPQLLFSHNLTVIAGDIKIHPYEGRYGSGGINKMLAVGVASLNEICRSHSTQVLMDRKTQVGNPASPFVRKLEITADNIRKTMLTKSGTAVMALPYGISVIAEREKIWGFSFGQTEASRREIAREWTQTFTVETPTDFDLVISDVDPRYAADLLAGARALQYICDWDTPENVILSHARQGCIALLFNVCNETKNNDGIGNDGAKSHLDVLADITQRKAVEIASLIPRASTVPQIIALLSTAKDQVLHYWEHHLRSISEANEWFENLRALALEAYRKEQLGLDNRSARQNLEAAFQQYKGDQNPIARAIAQIHQILQTAQPLSTVLNAIEQTAAIYQEHEGLGEGGQRTIRLLKICRHFNTCILATQNQAVATYFEALDPDLTAFLTGDVQLFFQTRGFKASILGLMGFDLTRHSPQTAIDLAMNYGEWKKPNVSPLNTCFLQIPLILNRI